MHQPAALQRVRESPENIALLSLEFGQLLMESGGSGRAVVDSIAQVATGLGADSVDVRVGFASLIINVGTGSNEITRMRKIGPIGVNQKLHQTLSVSAAEVKEGKIAAAELKGKLERIVSECRPHREWVVAVAVGLACASFGRLLDIDWAGVGPVFLAAGLAQFIRRRLAVFGFNVFLSTAVVAFLGSTLSGLGARLVGSQTVARDMVTTVLLLVPGVPAFNAQLDILEGRPTLGSARTVWILAILVFMSAGVWLALGLLGEGR